MVGQLRLEVGEFRMEVGDFRLVVGGFRLEAGEFRMVVGEVIDTFSKCLTKRNAPLSVFQGHFIFICYILGWHFCCVLCVACDECS